MEAREGPGRFQWSAGSWFGAQLGATIWIPLLGMLMTAQGRTAGIGVLGLAVAVNALGLFLWSRRASWDPYPAVQLLLGASTVAAVLSVALATLPGSSGDSFDLAPSLPTLLVYPGLMLVVHLQERSARSND